MSKFVDSVDSFGGACLEGLTPAGKGIVSVQERVLPFDKPANIALSIVKILGFYVAAIFLFLIIAYIVSRVKRHNAINSYAVSEVEKEQEKLDALESPKAGARMRELRQSRFEYSVCYPLYEMRHYLEHKFIGDSLVTSNDIAAINACPGVKKTLEIWNNIATKCASSNYFKTLANTVDPCLGSFYNQNGYILPEHKNEDSCLDAAPLNNQGPLIVRNSPDDARFASVEAFKAFRESVASLCRKMTQMRHAAAAKKDDSEFDDSPLVPADFPVGYSFGVGCNDLATDVWCRDRFRSAGGRCCT